MRTDGDGDATGNKIRVPLTANLTVNSNATLRARARWLRGHPEFLIRTAGSYLDTVGRMTLPSNLGTPGAANSRAVANAAPAIYDVRHEPILPAANQPIRISARVADPDGLGTVVVRYRIDPDTNAVVNAPMSDDGTGGDAVAGDGLFTAIVPGRASGSLIAFHVQASDNAVTPASRTFPADAPARECLIRFGETELPGGFGTYRIWMTQANINRWTTRLKLSNEAIDATFVQGRHRVIYNAGALYAGSPFHAPRYSSPIGVACDYKLIFPSDDRFLGSDEATIVWPGLTGGDPVDQTAQREVTCYGLAAALGLPFNYQRFVHCFVNGNRRSFIMQDTQKPDRDMLNQWFPDDPNGDLFKVQIWYELDATAAGVTTSIPATLGLFLSDGQKKTSRYRWNWTPRGGGATATDFRDLFALVDAVNSPVATYTANVEAVIDVEQWMRTMAVEHLVGNWDSYGYGNGQNMYIYKPTNGRWQMMMWDLDVSLGNASDPANADLFKLTNPYFPNLNGDPAVMGRMYQHPAFARAYWRAVQEAVDGPLQTATANALLDARATAFAANAVAAASADPIKIFLSARRSYCVGRLATVAASFHLDPPPSPITSNNLILVSGTAPITARDIVINGIPVPVTWTSVTSWTARVVLMPGPNDLVVQARDRFGRDLIEFRRTNTVTYTGSDVGLTGTLFINEWMASNAGPGGLPEPVSGNYEDWFELYNAGADAVDLSGFGLTDDVTAPFKFVVPHGYQIPGQGYLLVWADGQPSRNQINQPQLHVNFQLSRDGEALGLFAPDGRRIDAVQFGPQTNNVSQGRSRDGGPIVGFLVQPSPGAANNWGATNTLVITGIERAPHGEVRLSWPAEVGGVYRVEYRETLDAPAWTALGADYPGTGGTLHAVDSVATASQRFYRIRQLP